LALQKVEYKGRKTVISEENLNEIQDAIIALEARQRTGIFTHTQINEVDEFTDMPELVAGKIYTVNYDGADYVCMCRKSDYGTYLGNWSQVMNEYNEPFLIGYVAPDNEYSIVFDGKRGVTFAISEGYVGGYRYTYLGEPIASGELAFNNYYAGSPIDLSKLTVGKTYLVKWCGVLYECVLEKETGNDGVPYTTYRLGNDRLFNEGDGIGGTGEPFYFFTWYTGNSLLTNNVYKACSAAETLPFGVYEKA
jgi:hypothetical protein